MRVLSLGAGVQSSTILMMGIVGEEHLDAAVFADTGWEPQAVYRHLEWLMTQAELAGIPLYIERFGNIRERELSTTIQVGAKGKYSLMPLYLRGEHSQRGRLRRACTHRYKIEPVQKRLRKLGATDRDPVDLLMGISWDESERMRDSQVTYARHVYPLIERRMTRQDCLEWMVAHGFPEPPKSACVGCPFRRIDGWRRLRDESPAEWQDAIVFDDAIRNHYTAFGDTPYLSDERVPLRDLDLDVLSSGGVEADGCGVLCAGDEPQQLSLWGNA